MDVERSSNRIPGVPLALGSAVLFGASAPLSKLLLGSTNPQMLAGLLYAGAGFGLAGVHILRAAFGLSAAEAPPRRHDIPWLKSASSMTRRVNPDPAHLGLSAQTARSWNIASTMVSADPERLSPNVRKACSAK